MATQTPCPRCGSRDISNPYSPCLCHCRPSCWQYPVCNRCGYTNGSASANSEGVFWMHEGATFSKYTPSKPLDITPVVQERISRYDAGERFEEEDD